MKINDVNTALEIFEKFCIKQAEATEIGDYKSGNKYYSQIISAIDYLKSENSIYRLLFFLDSPFIGVRLWAATYMLPLNEDESKKVLEEIMVSSGIHSFTAKTTLNQWLNGTLKL